MNHKKLKLNQSGMTLIEIMIVLVIIGVLMGALGTMAMKQLQKSRVSTAQIQLKEIGKALDAYNLSCNSYPTTEQGLGALIQSPGNEVCPNWGPESYISKMPHDPWGHTFIYESDGATRNLKTLGRDGKEGGEGYDKDWSLQDLE